jgi:hypothetical protein
MKNITSRDVKVFLLGMLVMFLITLVYEWPEFMEGFKGGYNTTK